ncbi:hypothetical protein [Paenibacillus sp. NEAU-GSW1]|uniref:hypothetical protein n=1 Tax=Paenibacillus sp. NEAU-GSW1 TaxID=2682486 RepID=UPI0012E15DCA|nr:hypothetical protein [Paenibacillus sp. NEAU-GSW1]MUT66233.1 hypothetical protein [Paenibacillus sp. NEAU-GSW1]
MSDLLKIMKYDWKRNSSVIIGVAAVFIIVEALLLFGGSRPQWSKELLFVLSMLGFAWLGAANIFLMCKTYASNISSYSRRLLPVSGGWTVLSPLVWGLLGFIVLGAAVYGYILLYDAVNELAFDPLLVTLTNVAGGIFLSLWNLLFMVLVIFFAITIAKSVYRKKLGPWLGIATFFGIQLFISWLEHLIYKSDVNGKITQINSTSENVTMEFDLWTTQTWGSSLIQLVAAVLIFYSIIKLLNKRVQL